MKRTGIALLGCAATFLLSGQALADPETHDGFFFRGGLNLGLQMSSFEQAGGDADVSGLALGGDLLFGGTPVDGLVLGGGLVYSQTSDPTYDIDGFGEVDGDGTLLFLGVTGFAQYYFDPSDGLHGQLMLGYGAVDFVAADGSSGGNDPSGIMLGLGVGYDVWIGSEWSVGPFARLLYSPTSVETNGQTFDFTWMTPTIGAAITLH